MIIMLGQASRDTVVLRDDTQQARRRLRQNNSYIEEEETQPTAVVRPVYTHHRRENRYVSHRRDQAHDINGEVQSDSSFYFTNVPHDISYISLRQGFEVCGIMEDVYLARKRNVNGGAYGFVRYCKVKDVDKLLKAKNNIWFGDWKVVAKVASFDKFGKTQVVGGKRAEGEKINEGEKSKFEGVKNN
jgi:hypothetical protein